MKICFICTGNTCRSVMAERLMKKMLKKTKLQDIKVSSRGLNATGENIAENAKFALKKFGASASNRKSVKLGKRDVKTLYVTMTESQAEALKDMKVLTFKQLIGKDVLDPYGQDEEVYLNCCAELEKGVKVLIEKLENWRGL